MTVPYLSLYRSLTLIFCPVFKVILQYESAVCARQWSGGVVRTGVRPAFPSRAWTGATASLSLDGQLCQILEEVLRAAAGQGDVRSVAVPAPVRQLLAIRSSSDRSDTLQSLE